MCDEPLWLETDYFETFRCKGGACRNSCCENWQIAVGMKEYFELIGRETSPELHHRLECAFRIPEEPSPERFRLIAPNWMGRCPMHGDDGLCMLHAECGEGALPEICRIYPRSLKAEDGLPQACCSGSCEAVIEMLMAEEQLSFRFVHLHAAPELRESSGGLLLQTAPDCMRILQNREVPLRTRIERICARVNPNAEEGNTYSREEALQMLLSIMEKQIEDSPSLEKYGTDALKRYSGGDLSAYERDALLFESRFPQWENWYENILANHLLYAGFPCADARIQPEEHIHGLCTVYGYMRLIPIAYSAARDTQETVVDAIAGIFRLIEHSSFYYNMRLLAQKPLKLLAL